MFLNSPTPLEAAQSTIESTAATNGSSHTHSGPQTVFTSDQVGYKFFRDQSTGAAGPCVYKKTTDGGVSWSSPITVDAQTDCIGISVWYEPWTPGRTNNNIHILTFDTSVDDPFYNRLNANTDTLLLGTSPVSAITGSGQGGTYAEGTHYPTISQGTDGTIYIASNGTADSYVVECTSSCNVNTNWTETGTNPLDLATDYNLLMPLSGGNMLLINRDISAEDIRSKVWNNTTGTWSGSWTTPDADATDNTTYDIGMAATVSLNTGMVYLAYVADNVTLGTNDDVRALTYSGSSWTTRTDVITNSSRGLTSVAIGIDSTTDDVYVLYSGRTTAGTANTGNVYWKLSTNNMANWGSETGPINSSPSDMYGLDLNNTNDQRIFATWFDNTNDDIYGDTIADIFPGIHVTTSGTQKSTLRGGTNDNYIGGKFVLYENQNNHDVTGITITENGSVDGSSNIANVKLYYEMDTSAPYDCVSETYIGVENPFGSTDTNGFSGADGISNFTGSTVNVTTTATMCVYVVLDLLDDTPDGSTLEVSIANPVNDVTVTSSTAGPGTVQGISGTTNLVNDTPTLTHYHWRNDNGSEALATSRTSGVEDTPLTALPINTPRRLRIGVSNEGSTSTPSISYRLEYSPTTGTCEEAVGWIDVDDSDDDFNMYNSINLTDGNNTTNILVAGNGAISDENTSFLASNGAVKDTSSQTAGLVLSPINFVEFEYSIVASTTATEGNTYCFRLTDAGTPLSVYSVLPRATVASDLSVTALGSQFASTTVPDTDFYIGGTYALKENSGSRNVNSITITEQGSVDASLGLENVRLYYDFDTSAPYDCVSESYNGGESLFGTSDTDGFSSANGTSTFTDNVPISTTSSICLYIITDVNNFAQHSETIDVIIQNPSVDVVASLGASVSPTITRDITASTTLRGAILTQSHYHWRNDNGTETGATSATGGLEDTIVTNVGQTTPIRLRMDVSNEGAVTSGNTALRLEYAARITTCQNASGWIDVGASLGAFDMFNSGNLIDGNNTTNIAVSGNGAMTDENSSFKSPNSAIKDTSSQIATTTFSTTQFLETEFSIRATVDSAFDTTYCFRLTNAGAPLNIYNNYAELTTAPERDFEIQRGTVTVSGSSATITAGVDYVAPASSTRAFIRITNPHHTGAGRDTAGGGNQNADDVTAYISNPNNLLTSVTFTRPGTAINNTRVSWEIVEFVGTPGSDNEIVVRSQSAITYSTTGLTATGTVVSGVQDDNDVVVFITGAYNPDTALTDYNTMQSTSNWSSPSQAPLFLRGETGNDAVRLSYAVVEFIGQNWKIQRNEHTYTAAGVSETEAITAVNSLNRTFLHTQKRVGATLQGIDEFGHEVYLSGIGQLTYFLETGATTPSGQTSVAWIIENIQTNSGSMNVYRSNGTLNAGTEPVNNSVSIGTTLSDLTNSSIFINTRQAGTGTNFPRPMAGVTITSSTNYQVWRSEATGIMTYRTEVIDWPTAGLAMLQADYRFYVNNNLLTPTDSWPVGVYDLGENTVLTVSDEPLGEGEKIRIRMSLKTLNSSLPELTKGFKLQYGERVTTCSAVSLNSWVTLGDSASSTIWRGENATGTTDGTALSTNPPTGGDLLISTSDVSGTFEAENNSVANPYKSLEGEFVEYDWLIEQNGATAETTYCFRMVESDDTTLTYSNYPQIRTASFSPRTQNWRWYDDSENETPTNALDIENYAPIEIVRNNQIVLRITVKEIENIARDDVRFKLQFSEYPDFSVVYDVDATSSCTTASVWCYADGGGLDNAVITNSLLTDSDVCVAGVGDGCGTHNESPSLLSGFRHENNSAAEYSFVVEAINTRVGAVYYYRLYDVVQNAPVVTNEGESYPSLVTESATLVFNVGGLPSTTSTEGVVTSVSTSPNSIKYNSLPLDVSVIAAQRLSVSTNATEGYRILLITDSDLTSSDGSTILSINAENSSPTSWASGCFGLTSCFGYHSGDDVLWSGSVRFAADDTYAKATTTPNEIAASDSPTALDSIDLVFRLQISQLQPAGIYSSAVSYLAIPVF